MTTIYRLWLRLMNKKPALMIALVYVVLGALWISFSDRLLVMAVSDIDRLSTLQTFKGWFFVLASGLLIFVLVRSSVRALSRSEADLQESQELLGQVADHTGVAIWAYSPDATEILHVSRSAEELWKVPLEEIQRHPTFFLERIHPDDRPRVVDAFRGDGEMAVEYRVTRGDGETRWLRMLSSPVRNDEGGADRVVGITEDVTDTKRAERALRESERRFDQLAEHIPQVFWMTSVDGSETLYISRAYESIWGRSLESLRERPREWLDAAHPEDRARVAEAFARLPEDNYDLEYRILRPDGEIRWVRDRAFPVRDDQGEIRALAGTAEDITDRKRREEELLLLESAISQAGEGVMIIDTDARIQYINPAFEQMTGYAPGDALGESPAFLIGESEGPDHYVRMWSELLDGDLVHGRTTSRRKDGTPYTQDYIITPVRSRGDEITHMVAVLRDVTHELALEEQVRQSQKMEAVGRLAGGIAHDFNNVLTAIKGHTELALEDLEPSHPSVEEARAVLTAAGRAQSLTRQLLAFSRQDVSSPRVVDMSQAISHTEKMLARLIGDDVELELVLTPDLGRVKVDPTQLDQILVNLAVNARDAMPEGGRLTIQAENVEPLDDLPPGFTEPFRPGRYVRLRVTDTGVGMDAQTRERVFEPFFTTKAANQGTGLGLSTVFGIVKQNDGYIRVDSEPEAGATFEVFLPRTDEPVEETTGEAERSSGEVNGSETVLVVDDQPGVRSVVRRTLQRSGYTVLEADSGHDALAVWERESASIDLVLTDMIMPRMGGLELAERLRSERPGLPILFMSGHSEHEIPAELLEDRATHLLEKPFDAHTLRRRVRDVLDGAPVR